MRQHLVTHHDLKVYQGAAALRKQIFILSLKFPKDERYELTQQIRRSSRSICSSIGEAWRKRRYKAYWISKLSDAEQEAAEVQIWIETAVECGYVGSAEGDALIEGYERVIKQLTLMAIHADKWIIRD
jgi:four helix bundle protein